MSALARAATRTAAARHGIIASQTFRATSIPQVRSFWGGRRNSQNEWPRRWGGRLGNEKYDWEKNVERLSREMESHSKAVADRLRAYITKGEGESYIDPPFNREKTHSASDKSCWSNEPVNESGTSNPDARPLSEAQIKNLVQTTIKETLDGQFAEAENKLHRLVKDQYVAHAASVRSIIDDWGRRSPGFTKAVAEEVDKSLSKKPATVDPPRLREALAKELLNPELVDMLNKALGHTSNTEIRAIVSTAIKDYAASPQLLTLVRNEVGAAVIPRPELERITKDMCEHVVQKHKAYSQLDLAAKLADMREEYVDLAGQYLDTNGKKLRDLSQAAEAISEQLQTFDARVAMLRTQGTNMTLDALIDTRIDAAFRRYSWAPTAAKTPSTESEGARLEPALDRQLSTKPKAAASSAAPLGDPTAAASADSSSRKSSASSSAAPLGDPTAAASADSSSRKSSASPATPSNMSPPSFKMVHFHPGTRNIRIETLDIPGQDNVPPMSSSITMRAGQTTLASVHSEMCRQGYSVICRGEHVTVFGRGPVDLGRSPSLSDSIYGEGRRHGGRRRIVVRTAMLSAAGFLIIWWVHKVVAREILPWQVEENNHGMRAFKEFGGPGKGFSRSAVRGCHTDAASKQPQQQQQQQQQQQLDDELAELYNELGRIFNRAVPVRAN